MFSDGFVLPNLKYIFSIFGFKHVVTFRENGCMCGIVWTLIRNIVSGSYPDLLNKNLPFNKSPRWFIAISDF